MSILLYIFNKNGFDVYLLFMYNNVNIRQLWIQVAHALHAQSNVEFDCT